MPVTNFKFFALSYLNDWCLYDHRFVTGLAPENGRLERIKALREAAAYYKVARTLKGCGGEQGMDCALDELDKLPPPATDAAVDDIVCRYTEALQAQHKKYVVSAASKFLWLRHRW